MDIQRIVVAFDGEAHGHDALALGRLLARRSGGELELAHVHHTEPVLPGGEAAHARREQFLTSSARELLAAAAPDVERRHAIAATTTATGLLELATGEQIDVLVFGSARGTVPGLVHPGSATRRLLQRSPSAIAIAPAGFAAVAPDELGELLEIDSSLAATPGQVAIGPDGERLIRSSTRPVLVVPRNAGAPALAA